MSKINIFLDDYRPCPLGYECARDYNTFEYLVKKNKDNIGTISLDFNLDSIRNGYDAAKFLVDNNIVVENFIIHSSHSKRKKIYELLKENYPNVEIKLYYPL